MTSGRLFSICHVRDVYVLNGSMILLLWAFSGGRNGILARCDGNDEWMWKGVCQLWSNINSTVAS